LNTKFAALPASLALCLALAWPQGDAAAERSIEVYADGALVRFAGALPIVADGTTLVPVRPIAEALGAEVTWRPESNRIVFAHDEAGEIVVAINSGAGTVDGRPVVFGGEPPRIVDGHTYVPLRFIAQSFGYDVAWNEAARTIRIERAARPTPAAPPAGPPSAVPPAPAEPPATAEAIKRKLSAAKDVKYYLDRGDPTVGEAMKRMDLVIVEPVEMQQSYIEAAQASGTLVYGYINAMEADRWNEALYERFEEEDFYKDEDGKRVYYEQWDSFQMDMTSAHYRDILMEEIEKQIVARGLDGVFLDTVGNIDAFVPADRQPEQNEALKQFVIEVKQRYGGLSVAQNWGFDTLVNYTAPYIDFIMWEDFSYAVVGRDDWAAEQMERLKQVRDVYGTQVVAIAFSDDAESRALAERHGFKYVYNEAGSYYNEW